jgi:hypothetical protein
LALATSGTAFAAPTPKPVINQFTYAGEVGDYVSQGKSASFVAGTSGGVTTTISKDGSKTYLGATVVQGNYDHWWYVHVAAPAGEKLKVGRYEATRWPFQKVGVAGFSVSGDGRGCNVSTSEFTIKKISFDRTGVQSIDMSFVQFCDGRLAPMRGTLKLGLKG